MFKKILSLSIAFAFFLNSLGNLPQAYADSILVLPQPGIMVNLSPAFVPAHLMGLQIDPKNPFHLDFLINNEQNQNNAHADNQEYLKMVKYFMGALTVPNTDQWVNLSPYENRRIISPALGMTEMGRDLLAQDYILKQLTASLIYPEKAIGKKFWGQIYQQIYAKYGADVKIPVNTFNKVWIMPESAVLYEKGNQVWIAKSTMKVMLETDYLALMKAEGTNKWGNGPANQNTGLSTISENIIRDIIIPVIKKEVNEGRNFAKLRQIYNAMVLATWYKMELKQSILNSVYGDARKVRGITLADKSAVERIYRQYLQAYRKGVFNYIKQDIDPVSQEIIPRKYFSGGFNAAQMSRLVVPFDDLAGLERNINPGDRAMFNAARSGVLRVGVSLVILSALGLSAVVMNSGSAHAAEPPVRIHSLQLGDTISPQDQRDINNLYKLVSAKDVRHLKGANNPLTRKAFEIEEFKAEEWNNAFHQNKVVRLVQYAIEAFQIKYKFSPVTGVLDDKTRALMEKLVKSKHSRTAGAPPPKPEYQAKDLNPVNPMNKWFPIIPAILGSFTPAGVMPAVSADQGYETTTVRVNLTIRNFPRIKQELISQGYMTKQGFLTTKLLSVEENVFAAAIPDMSTSSAGLFYRTYHHALEGKSSAPAKEVSAPQASPFHWPWEGLFKPPVLTGANMRDTGLKLDPRVWDKLRSLQFITANGDITEKFVELPWEKLFEDQLKSPLDGDEGGETDWANPPGAQKIYDAMMQAVKAAKTAKTVTPIVKAPKAAHHQTPHLRPAASRVAKAPAPAPAPAQIEPQEPPQKTFIDVVFDAIRGISLPPVTETPAPAPQAKPAVLKHTKPGLSFGHTRRYVVSTKGKGKVVVPLPLGRPNLTGVVIDPTVISPDDLGDLIKNGFVKAIDRENNKLLVITTKYANDQTKRNSMSPVDTYLQSLLVMDAKEKAKSAAAHAATTKAEIVVTGVQIDPRVISSDELGDLIKSGFIQEIDRDGKKLYFITTKYANDETRRTSHTYGDIYLQELLAMDARAKARSIMVPALPKALQNPLKSDVSPVQGYALPSNAFPNIDSYYKNKLTNMAMIHNRLDAQRSARTDVNGGINFDSAQLTIRIKRDGQGMPLPLNFQDPSLANLKGLFPVVVSIQLMPQSDVPRL